MHADTSFSDECPASFFSRCNPDSSPDSCWVSAWRGLGWVLHRAQRCRIFLRSQAFFKSDDTSFSNEYLARNELLDVCFSDRALRGADDVSDGHLPSFLIRKPEGDTRNSDWLSQIDPRVS